MDERGPEGSGQLFAQQRGVAPARATDAALHGTQRTNAIAKSNASSAGNCLATHDAMLAPRPFEASRGRFGNLGGAPAPQKRSNNDSTALW